MFGSHYHGNRFSFPVSESWSVLTSFPGGGGGERVPGIPYLHMHVNDRQGHVVELGACTNN